MKCWALQKQRNFIFTSKKISVPWGLTWKMWITITWTVGIDQMSTHRELESTWSLVKGGVLSLVGHLRLLLVAHHYHLVGVFQIRSFSYTTDIYEYERYNWHIWLKKILKFLDLPSRRDRFCSLLHPYQAGSEGQNIRRVQISCKYREIRAWQIQNTNGWRNQTYRASNNTNIDVGRTVLSDAENHKGRAWSHFVWKRIVWITSV